MTVPDDLGGFIGFQFPIREQSPMADFFIMGIPGVVGSSFACPLHASVAALGVSLQELTQRQCVSQLQAHAGRRPDGRAPNAHPSMVAEVHQLYLDALKRLPHAHTRLQTQLRPELPLVHGHTCIHCGVYAEQLYVKAGLWMLEINSPAEAIGLLMAATEVAPWNAEAHAFLAITFHRQPGWSTQAPPSRAQSPQSHRPGSGKSAVPPRQTRSPG